MFHFITSWVWLMVFYFNDLGSCAAASFKSSAGSDLPEGMQNRSHWNQRSTLENNMEAQKITQLIKKIIFKSSICGFYVNFPGCIPCCLWDISWPSACKYEGWPPGDTWHLKITDISARNQRWINVGRFHLGTCCRPWGCRSRIAGYLGHEAGACCMYIYICV